MHEAYFILYVEDKASSAAYYATVLDREPIVDVDGITEFRLNDGSIFAVMPVDSAARLLGDAVFRPAASPGSPKAELYLVVDDPDGFHARALTAGGKELSPMQRRDWGHRAAYSIDTDGYVLAFAEKLANSD